MGREDHSMRVTNRQTPNLIFICGPYRAATAWAREQNVRLAEDVAAEVVRLGAFPVCPHSNTRPYFEGLASGDRAEDDEFWLSGTLELLRRCDAVATVPGWERSSGAIAEVEEAERIGIPVFDGLFTVPRGGVDVENAIRAFVRGPR